MVAKVFIALIVAAGAWSGPLLEQTGLSLPLRPVRKTFAWFTDNHHGDGRVAVWLPAPPGVQSALIEQEPAVYFRPPYVGHKGWVGIELAHIGDDALEFHVQTAWELIAPRRLL